MITFENVTKQYPDVRGRSAGSTPGVRGRSAGSTPGGTTAVDTLNLQIEPESFTVFVGPSGCGKTTSMRMINRMITPTSGVITVDGKNIADTDAVALRRGIGYVIQSAGLLPHRTVVDNVATVPVLRGESRRSARKAALTVLERVGLDPAMASRYPAQLSGGQQQRVGVARALAADPPILLMDEPFSAVDPVVREDLQTEMLRLQAELKKTIVFVTHDIDEAVRLGDRIAVFGTGGRLQQYDRPEVVLASPATDFVASFVGRDRGYRGLSFRTADTVPLHDIETSTADNLKNLRLEQGQWVLVVTDANTPLGWIDVTGVEGIRAGDTVERSTAAGGSLFTVGGDLRLALDAAISSPSGIGVAVDDQGRVAGGIDGSEVLEHLAAQRRAEDQDRNKHYFGDAPLVGDGLR
ncbi:ATP-binding cassette domain-containing protein [Rhodococcus sp. BP-252]|uniref:ABC-type quaternary amine transporter n=1 Tax=Rhodococcoides kyotonense TaxID=398843 RepID=A0A177YBS7_9NOCA|nr:ATP-binding cassette domain-containing protein [Rhodococcus sp. BP-320]MBY6419799.1 ATP-binding cassette domain-containing protein [Rhodococcus sp. BP-321]MBY6424756.1 ATP-binding cassette domain-containing protein [Rhodococcus sp. BP-324]MBY6427798.1 ATP-binding cassette domain-containing protein [Rhodococcus sp. BP-323]MBY6432983.1 ATP-binding cassette domain-containing protein [Rhodococcus sp. BP-322]MBY6441794.1 ATP-binding cassette domain-containing protein [Rhodococcus sp. BP-319]MBY